MLFNIKENEVHFTWHQNYKQIFFIFENYENIGYSNQATSLEILWKLFFLINKTCVPV